MRFSFFMIATLILSACSRGEPSEITVELDKPTRVKDCNVWLRSVTIKPDSAFMTWKCNVPESAPNWWGEGMEPPAATILEGDCVLLDQKFYCVKDINPENLSATLVATYESLYDEQIRPLR
jgi:hypothetical protein